MEGVVVLTHREKVRPWEIPRSRVPPSDRDSANSATDLCSQTGSSPEKMEDSRGVTRGACKVCSCPQYCPPGDETSSKCTVCDHFPTKHQNLRVRKMCRFPGCYQPLDFDLNTGEERLCCSEHDGYIIDENVAETSIENTAEILQVQDIDSIMLHTSPINPAIEG